MKKKNKNPFPLSKGQQFWDFHTWSGHPEPLPWGKDWYIIILTTVTLCNNYYYMVVFETFRTLFKLFVLLLPAGLPVGQRKSVANDHHPLPHRCYPFCFSRQCDHHDALHACHHKVQFHYLKCPFIHYSHCPYTTKLALGQRWCVGILG